ncbi:OmpA family protein [Nisaea acidiphila]|uniref:OmpA family protein n=1 Tax=Nisaea acidiphila TaxID=1862145 RepID=A0A9J7AYG9_9PROT|nr:flagellar motor protein MotB [Nisaea acidiphila]UUX50477.1 OmpA family protein [Nisaea acidiphila]
MESAVSRRQNRRTAGNGVSWMVTFVDLVSLLLAFFVLLFSMTTPDAPQWESFTASLRSAFSSDNPTRARQAVMPETIRSEDPGLGFDLGYLQKLLKAELARDAILRDARVTENGGRLVISMASDVFFAPGAAVLRESGEGAMFNLAVALSQLDNRIDIVGHTDPRPFISGTGKFSSNWELSLARAVAVAEALRRFGYEKPVEVRGAADGKFAEIDARLEEEERFRRARRVDLVIYKERDR